MKSDMKFDTIIFDLEGVIVDTEKLWDKESELVLGKRGIKYNKEEIKHMATGRDVFDVAKTLIEHFGLDEDVRKLGEERVQIMQKLIAEEGEFMPGFIEFFESIKDSFKTGIATSAEDRILKAINDKLDIKSEMLFRDRIYPISLVNNPKPAPDIFLYAAEKLGSKPENCIVIEDAPSGIKAGKTVGMFVIALTTTHYRKHLKEADRIVDSFDEIKEFISDLS